VASKSNESRIRVERLDRLNQRLLDELDQQADLSAGSCLGLAALGQLATGTLDPQTRERAETHLNDCLVCAYRFVDLRDDLHGLASPGPVSGPLSRHLDKLIGREPEATFWMRTAKSLRRAFVFRIPAWTAAGLAAGLMLMTWTAAYKFQRPSAPPERPFVSAPTSSERLKPARSQVSRTVSGMVSSIRDATSNGVEAHVVSLTDASGATYVLFAWGRPTVRPGEAVEIEAVFTNATQSAGGPVYQGLATELRRAR